MVPRPVFSSLKYASRMLTFGYQNGLRPALRDISFTLRKGEKLGIVGPSGAGKSTLVSLMLRFFDPQKGRILLGGRDLRDLSLSFLRRHIAVVAQDTYLFYGTVAENLRLARAAGNAAGNRSRRPRRQCARFH